MAGPGTEKANGAAEGGGDVIGVVVLPSTFFKPSGFGKLNPVELVEEGCKEPEKGGNLTGGSGSLFFSKPKEGPESDVVDGAIDGPSLGALFPSELGEEKVMLPLGCEKGDGLSFGLGWTCPCAVSDGFAPRPGDTVEPGKAEIGPTAAEVVGLLVLAGAEAGDGEAKKLGLGWLVPP